MTKEVKVNAQSQRSETMVTYLIRFYNQSATITKFTHNMGNNKRKAEYDNDAVVSAIRAEVVTKKRAVAATEYATPMPHSYLLRSKVIRITTLPNENIMNIFAYANVEDLESIFSTCRRFHGLEKHVIPEVLQAYMLHLCDSGRTVDGTIQHEERVVIGDERWEHLPLIRRFTKMVMKKITIELNVPGRLEFMVEDFNSMLANNNCTSHQNYMPPLDINIMSRVLGCFYQLEYKRQTHLGIDLANLLTGKGFQDLNCPCEIIFEILLDALGYDNDIHGWGQFPHPWIFTGMAGTLGFYQEMINEYPDFILTPFLDRVPLSNAAEKKRLEHNIEYVERLFTWIR